MTRPASPAEAIREFCTAQGGGMSARLAQVAGYASCLTFGRRRLSAGVHDNLWGRRVLAGSGVGLVVQVATRPNVQVGEVRTRQPGQSVRLECTVTTRWRLP